MRASSSPVRAAPLETNAQPSPRHRAPAHHDRLTPATDPTQAFSSSCISSGRTSLTTSSAPRASRTTRTSTGRSRCPFDLRPRPVRRVGVRGRQSHDRPFARRRGPHPGEDGLDIDRRGRPRAGGATTPTMRRPRPLANDDANRTSSDAAPSPILRLPLSSPVAGIRADHQGRAAGGGVPGALRTPGGTGG